MYYSGTYERLCIILAAYIWQKVDLELASLEIWHLLFFEPKSGAKSSRSLTSYLPSILAETNEIVQNMFYRAWQSHYILRTHTSPKEKSIKPSLSIELFTVSYYKKVNAEPPPEIVEF